MDTNKLINTLADNLTATQPVKPALQASLQWGGFATIFLAGACGYIGFRPDMMEVISGSAIMAEALLFIMIGLVASYVALDLRVPQSPLLFKNKGLLAVASLGWIGFIAYYAVNALYSTAPQEHLHVEDLLHECIVELVAISSVLSVYMLYMLKKGATTQRLASGYACLLACASFGALAMRFLCPNEEYLHLLALHFLPVLGLASIGATAGKLLLRW